MDNPPTLPAIITAYEKEAAAKAAAEKAAFERVVEKDANENFTAAKATVENADSSTNYRLRDKSVTEDPIIA